MKAQNYIEIRLLNAKLLIQQREIICPKRYLVFKEKAVLCNHEP